MLKSLRSLVVVFFITTLILPGNASILYSQVKHPAWSKNSTIYEVNVRQYTPEGTFAAFEKHLPRLKELGTDILWLMPIHPIGELNRKGSLGSYYAVRDYKAVNPEFGNLEDFKHLVKSAHSLGMYVIIDWVANHTSPDNIWTKTNPEFFTKDSTGNFISPVKDWSDVIDLNYDNKELWTAMSDAMLYWVKECDIDGFRCDVAAMVPTEFWNELRPRLDSIKPVFMLAEAHEPYLHEKAFDMTYNWQMKDIMNDIAKGKKNANDIVVQFNEKEAAYPKDAYRMAFTTNHDENTWSGSEYERLGEGVEAFTALTFIIKGMPLIYSGQESGLAKRLKFFDKDTIEWKKSHMTEVFSKLTSLKDKNQALWNGISGGEMVRIPTDNEESVYAVYREKNGSKVVGLFNLSPKDQKVSLSDKTIEDSYTDVITGMTRKISANESFNLKPWGYIVLSK